jgi:pantothenate kinase
MIPASLDSGHRMIADTLAAFRAGPALGSIALRPAPGACPLYIGIAGGKRSGKDTLANGLASALALPCDSFAAPLRQFVASPRVVPA